MKAPVRFNTKASAQAWININKGDIARYFTPTFVSDHYAEAHGVKTGGWYISTHAAGPNHFETA